MAELKAEVKQALGKPEDLEDKMEEAKVEVEEKVEEVQEKVEKVEEKVEVKETKPDTKEEMWVEFTAKGTKQEGKLGCSVETLMKDFCIVKRVEPWCSLKDVEVFDRIVKVNGIGAKAARLTKILVENEDVELSIQRPQKKEVTLEKGIDFGIYAEMETTGAVISTVSEEASALGLKPMDRISAVNGTENMTVAEVLRSINNREGPLRLDIVSYSP